MNIESIVKQRMTIMRKAVGMHQAEGYTKVLEAYDAMWNRITIGMNTELEIAITSEVERLINSFITDCLVLTSDVQKIQATPVFNAFSEWCIKQGIAKQDIPGMHSFGKAMRTRFNVKHSGVVYYLGIAFKEEAAKAA